MNNPHLNSTSVGILANPESGRDIRRLMANASLFLIAEKCNIIQKMLLALANVGVSNVVMMPDRSGVAAGVIHDNEIHRSISPDSIPNIHFIEMPIDGSPVDTVRAIEQMVKMGVGAIIVLGGDSTHRLVAKVCGATPIVPFSIGNNNVFPEFHEATAVGTAAGLVAIGAVPLAEVSRLNKVLRVEKNDTINDLALVDLCITNDQWLGTKSLWHPDSFSELYLTFAEADSIGLSSIAGRFHPVRRCSPYGLRLELVPPCDDVIVISAPIAPGLIVNVGVSNVTEILPKEVWHVNRHPYASRGVVALDGEQEIEFGPSDHVKVWLENDGPTTVNVREVLAKASENHCFVKFPVMPLENIEERRDAFLEY